MVVVNMAELRSVAQNRLGGVGAGGVIGHIHERANSLKEIADECETVLRGGYGKTGGFQDGLQVFPEKFTELLESFNTGHLTFVAFLEGLRDRMNAAAGAYQETELRNIENMSSISRTLSPE